jgi:HEAT repeat protein
VRLLPRRRPKIEQLKEAGDLDGLRAMLDHTNVSEGDWDDHAPMRAEAVTALAAFDGPVVEDGVAHALSDPDSYVRLAAVDAIAARPSPIAVWPLLEAVAEWPYPAEYAAIEKAFGILVRWAPDGGAEALARGLSHPAAAELDRRHHDALKALIDAAPREGAEERVAAALVTELEAGDADRAARAEQMLMWLDAPATDSVLSALDGDSPGVGVIRVAGLLRDARAVEPLVALLGSSDAAVRSEGATALGRLNDTRAVQPLLSATQDPDQTVRDCATEALDSMGAAAVIVGVASVLRETVREQLAAGEPDGTPPELPSAAPVAPDSAAPEAAPAVAGHPPTWAQGALGRFLRRAGGQR